MFETILWITSFFTLWVTIIWLHFLFVFPEKKILKRFPSITIAIPCFNEERTLMKTVKSVYDCDYPKELLQVLIVNDGSTDQTRIITERAIERYENMNISLISQENQGKAVALNAALDKAVGEYFACIDADTEIDYSALRNTLHWFEEDTAAVISVVKLKNKKNIYEKLQNVDYILSNLLRRLMSVINTLAITHGALTTFKTSILRRIGGFTKDSGHTEDLEVALHLKSKGYDIRMAKDSFSYTQVPSTFRSLWTQRIRWFRGFIYNHWKYRKMFLSRKHGLFGTFQFPLGILSVVFLVLISFLIAYKGLNNIIEQGIRVFVIKGYFFNHLITLPSFKDFILSKNLQLYVPLIVLTLFGIRILIIAYRNIKEDILNQVHMVLLYYLCAPLVTTLHWSAAFFKEVFNAERKWR